jgi:Protein of unknown function (DUF4127)
MKYVFFSLWAFFNCLSTAYSQKSCTSCVLLIPLDDRPPCLQFPIKMGLIGDVEIVTPPRPLLGRFTQFGQCDSIILWLKNQNLSKFDAVIISMDMLAYGGLVASRVNETPINVAQNRLKILEEIRQKAPKIKIYGSSVIMRLAPTGDGKNEAYREKLSRWADLSPYPENKEAVAQLEREIPTDALNNYKNARKRNLKINQLALDLAEKKVFNYLILSQDDAKPKGIHIRDRETLIEMVKTRNLGEKVAIQPGADEVSMLLLARAMTDKYNYHPKVKAVFTSDSVANKVMPFEDRPLSKTVSFHLKAIGAKEVTNEKEADIVFYVFASRFEKGRAISFSNEVIDFTRKKPKKGLIVADIDPQGDVQGGDTTFTEALKKQQIFSKSYGYACWNTAGNTIGTALPHGILYGISQHALSKKKRRFQRTETAQAWFMLNRLLDDYTYHSIVRPMALKKIKENKWNSFRLTAEQNQIIKADCLKILEPIALNLAENYGNTEGGKKIRMSNFVFDLPWSRTFEAEINFEINK